jgi:hypothetical protein
VTIDNTGGDTSKMQQIDGTTGNMSTFAFSSLNTGGPHNITVDFNPVAKSVFEDCPQAVGTYTN